MTRDWGLPDHRWRPARTPRLAHAFNETHRMLQCGSGFFVALPLKKLAALSLQAQLRDIGRMEGATERAKDQS